MTQITPQQALQNLYIASRKANLTADEHQLLTECAKVIEEIISVKTEKTSGEKKK